MEYFEFTSIEKINNLLTIRSGETKIGESINTIENNLDIDVYLKNSNVKYVIFGICEDIGIKANFGRVGAREAFNDTLKSFVNLQKNPYLNPNEILLLGHFNFENLIKETQNLNVNEPTDRNRLNQFVEIIDAQVSFLIYQIISNGKIPIVIGGGHNNAYGAIKGLSLAKAQKVNALNFDAHTDFRPLEGRHSGNGFSYAMEEGFLNRYFIFGVHQNYLTNTILKRIEKNKKKVKFNTFEDLQINQKLKLKQQIKKAIKFVCSKAYGLEIDLDAVATIHSSAMTLSGFSVNQTREFIYKAANKPNCSYLHLCEGAPSLDHSINNHLTGKLIAQLIADFIYAKSNLELSNNPTVIVN